MWTLIGFIALFWFGVAGWTMAWKAERGWKQAIKDRTAAIRGETQARLSYANLLEQVTRERQWR